MGIAQRDYMRERRSPEFSWRRPDAVPVIIAVCVAVFLLWATAGGRGSFAALLAENFTVSLAGLRSGRVWTLLTAAFSHNRFWHLLLAMFLLYGFGTAVEERWGRRTFVLFYLGAALCASLAHVAAIALGWPDRPALGASGAVSAVIVAYAVLLPRRQVYLFGLVPLPAPVAVVLLVLIDIAGLSAQKFGAGLPIGHGAHLGGAAFGLAYALLLTRGLRRARRRRGGAHAATSRAARAPEVEAGPARESPEQRLDGILAKVSRGGLDSLSDDERRFLEEMSRRFRR